MNNKTSRRARAIAITETKANSTFVVRMLLLAAGATAALIALPSLDIF